MKLHWKFSFENIKKKKKKKKKKKNATPIFIQKYFGAKFKKPSSFANFNIYYAGLK